VRACAVRQLRRAAQVVAIIGRLTVRGRNGRSPVEDGAVWRPW
jgi:hypothetical protein